jgi:hypothetical protein
MVETSTETLGSLRKNFHTQPGSVVGHGGLGICSVTTLLASSKVMTGPEFPPDAPAVVLAANTAATTVRAITDAMMILFTTAPWVPGDNS